LNLPAEHDSWDFGSGASFYVDATTPGYKDHYLMESYVVEELHQLIQEKFAIPAKKISLFGHSMGGHGALTLGLRHPEKFASVSAFSPIVNPIKAPWGVKAFTGYFGNNEAEWIKHDATELLRQGHRHPQTLLIDQGTEDEFLAKGQLLTGNIKSVAAEVGQKMEVNMRDGYDHSYYFISTFVESHLRFHAKNLN
jgi:S-formylglutathione hydrolase